jgi:hypothetical protein
MAATSELKDYSKFCSTISTGCKGSEGQKKLHYLQVSYRVLRKKISKFKRKEK